MALIGMTLTETERDRRWNLVREQMHLESLQALIIHGSTATGGHGNGNLRWMANLNHEGFLYFPLAGSPTLFGIAGGERPGWVPDYRGALPDVANALEQRLTDDSSSGRVGLVGVSGLFGQMYGFPLLTYNRLSERLPRFVFPDATHLVERPRSIKSSEEIRALELACEIMRVTFERLREFLSVGVAEYQIRALLMDTMFRLGSEPYGLFLYRQGKRQFHAGQGGFRAQPPTDQRLAGGDVIITELETVVAGYKAQFNHAFIVGDVDDHWHRVFAVAAEAFAAGLDYLRPGIDAKDLDRVMLKPIYDSALIHTNPSFHGIGLSLELPIGAAPRLGYDGASHDILAGMVLEFEPHPVQPDYSRGASMGCPIVVTEGGCRSLAPWYSPQPTTV